MGTKQTPGRFDCHAKAKPDEPMFVLLARDHRAPKLVEDWADLAERNGSNPEKVAEARECAAHMRAWRKANNPVPVAECVSCGDTIEGDKAKSQGWHWGGTGYTCQPKWLCTECRADDIGKSVAWHPAYEVSASGDIEPCLFTYRVRLREGIQEKAWPIGMGGTRHETCLYLPLGTQPSPDQLVKLERFYYDPEH